LHEVAQATAAPAPGFAPEIQALLDMQSGARFLKVDLQVHTPADPQFPGDEPKDANARRALAREYLGAARQRGIDAIGVTEHNDVSWIDDLRYAANGLGLHLLPGFEVETKEGIHVLCLFDPETKVARLEEFLVQLGLTAEKRAPRRYQVAANRDLPDLLDFIQDGCGGICIAAHIESDKGLLVAVRESARVSAWKTRGLLAAQISRPPHEITSGNGRIIRGEEPIYERDRKLAYVLTSDARSPETIGTTWTWIKMDEVGVEGLRQAFLDPGSRISFEDPRERRQGGRLLGVKWDAGFLGDVGFPLNPELNALIGGRGTGKSTVVETIRYAFDLGHRTGDVKDAAELLRQRAFKSGSKISVVIETDAPARKKWVIERTSPHAPVVRDELGQPRPELDPQQLLRPCVYGQKEIYGVAQDPPALLSLLDGFCADELRVATDKEQELLEACRVNARVLIDTQHRIDDAESKLAELPNLEEWRKQFREAGFDDLLRERRQLDREDRLFGEAEKVLSERERHVRSLNGDDRMARVLELPAGEEELPNRDLLNTGYEVLDRADQRWHEASATLGAVIADARTEIDRIRALWTERREARTSEFDAALRTLQERMPDVDPARYLDVERRIEQLIPLRESVAALRKAAADARDERVRLLIELADARSERYRIRDRAAKSLNQKLAGTLVVDVTYRGDRARFADRLAGLKTGARKDNLTRMVSEPNFTPATFATAVRTRDVQTKLGLPAGQATALETTIDEQTLLELEVDDLPDSVELKLDVALGGTPEYRSLDRLSPGQKSTAILLLVMQESKDPLLIDQPEDDLDNRFIYEDVVKRLREAKPARQFLVATHNANIPILGDAEQIVVLDAKEIGGPPVRGYVRTRGSIDAASVRDAAEEILEGGKEAFELRQQKYRI
jgi:energy-coupling factor transporter ATP-binding protein EcfA2